ncbi:MAG: hypothetical protein LBQ12_15115 [Deltaproteobacteria bacterium]|jgi:hypothetical protein|nr:hypothetical protein [Deltaproteobacteria bacterium]
MTDSPGRKRRVRAFATGALAAAAFVLAGCVLTMPQPFLKERTLESGVIPVLNGRWQDQEGAQLTFTPVKGTSNTFLAVSGKQEGSLRITLERLDSERFIMQVVPPSDGKPQGEGQPKVSGQGVFLTIAEASDRRVSIYTYPDTLEDIRKAAEANGVTITENGLITKYTSAQGIVAFFRGLAAMPGHKDFVITKK